MFEALDGLDAAGVLAAAVARRRAADTAEVELVELAAHWADLHAVLPGQEGARVVVPGMQRLVRLAGVGTPEVAEFAPAELGAALSLSTFAASSLVGDALELRHRLPRLWARMRAGKVPAWRARKVAEATRILSVAAAAWVDGQVVGCAHKIGIKRLMDLVAAAMLQFDPQEAARRAQAARSRRGVYLSDEVTIGGSRSVHIEADALDVACFDATITAIAAALAAAGDTDREQARRAKAIGLIADPQATLELLANGTPDHDPADLARDDDTDHPDGAAGDKSNDAAGGSSDGVSGKPGRSQEQGRRKKDRQGRARRPFAGGRPVLYIHLHADAVAAHGAGALARVEGGGPEAATAEQVMSWLGHTDMRIQPVRDLAGRVAVDAYEAPTEIEEIVVLRNPCCPFPWCNNLTRNKDIDHIKSYVPPAEGGPPGQTAPDKMAAPCRRHHRLKTHGGWSYVMPEPGIYLWRSPMGQRYLVDHTGTTNLTEPAVPRAAPAGPTADEQLLLIPA